jgi:hypothetical protein
MTWVAPAIFPGRIGSGWPASFHHCIVSGDKIILMPHLVQLLDFVPWEKKSTSSISKSVLLSDHVSWVNSRNIDIVEATSLQISRSQFFEKWPNVSPNSSSLTWNPCQAVPTTPAPSSPSEDG